MPTQVQAALSKERVPAYRTHPTIGFKVCAATGRVCGVATHAVGGDAGYSLLKKYLQNDLACNQYPQIKYFMLIRRSDFM